MEKESNKYFEIKKDKLKKIEIIINALQQSISWLLVSTVKVVHRIAIKRCLPVHWILVWIGI